MVEGAGLAVQLVQAGVAHGVGAAQADGLVTAVVKLMVADGAGQELGPLGRLHRHPLSTGGRCGAHGDRMSPQPDSSLTAGERKGGEEGQSSQGYSVVSETEIGHGVSVVSGSNQIKLY